ncbi:hypothetical protein VSH64_33970 [Amycolatopsis rhabdoformis]|uniref:Lipoprotein n=1 Tax=Amycolatopsis rhabdoformis TaxID=1448059 RepID=A0ABZ1I1Z0_9PSEU|nr:hypothetical protein [Amycolatopsis rhabdoformis]WSE27828.1 hypothetical protein VSH64_33970 [Amycolatopsis rhabdoformis]
MAVLVLCDTACTSSAEQLDPIATKGAREKASAVLGELRSATPPTRESIDRAVTRILAGWNTGGVTVLLRKDIPAAGRFTASFALLSFVGGGVNGEYIQYAVRLCVSYSGDVNRPGSTEMADLTCPPGLPDPSDSVRVRREVKLTD